MVKTVQKATRENREIKANRVSKVFREYKVTRVIKATRETKVFLASTDRTVPL
jgi:catabolite regulation protein CreA